MSDTIKLKVHGRVLLVTLNRPKALNALNSQVMNDMVGKLAPYDRDPEIGCIVISGSEKAFAAGADINEMSEKNYMDMFHEDYFASWDVFAKFRTPKIAAVSGFALGGGCELAMMCEIIYCSKSAKYGQPEIKLGVIPGMGGSQRLTKLVGKVKSMDLILTGRMMDANEALQANLVARVFDDDELLEQTLKAAEIIAGYGKTAAMVARECVERALEGSLQDGLLFERRVFHSLFATADQSEGMQAFIEKRRANFTGR